MRNKSVYYLMLCVVFIFFYYLAYNYQDILSVAYLISGDIKNFGHSFDYLVHSRMLSFLPVFLYPFISLGLSTSVISKFVSAVFSLLYLLGIIHFLKPYERNRVVCLFLGLCFLATTYFSIPTNYSFDIIRTSSSGGFVGTVLASISFLLFLRGGSLAYLSALITFIFHPVLGSYCLLMMLSCEIFSNESGRFLPMKNIGVSLLIIPLFFSLKYLFSILLPAEAIETDITLYTDIISNWDIHREVVSYSSPEFLLVSLSFFFSTFYLLKNGKNKIITLLGVSSLFYIIFIIAFNNFFDYLPSQFLATMPQRFSLYPIFVITLFVLSECRQKGGRGVTFLFLLIPIIFNIVAYLGFFSFLALSYLKIIYLFSCLIILEFNIDVKLKNRKATHVSIIICILMSLFFYKFKYQNFITPTDELSKIDVIGNVLSCSSCYPVTVRNKFSNLINLNEVDTVSYIPEVSQYFSILFKDIYEVSFDEANVGKSYQFYIDQTYEQRLWEKRKRVKWHSLSRKYNIKGVLVPGHWKLDLPSKELGQYKLYLL